MIKRKVKIIWENYIEKDHTRTVQYCSQKGITKVLQCVTVIGPTTNFFDSPGERCLSFSFKPVAFAQSHTEYITFRILKMEQRSRNAH